MTERLRRLRVGDHIRILAVPGEGVPGFYLHEDTRKLFKFLVAERAVLRIERIDEEGMPWVAYRWPCTPADDCAVDHLGLDEFDVWEIVTERASADS